MATKKLAKIRFGTVIDHIKAGNAIKVLEALRIPKRKYTISILINVPSKQLGRKDIIKIEGIHLEPEKVAKKIRKLAPKATINLISNKRVKVKVRIKELRK